jgi:predicted nucleic acid-binding protein
VIAETAWMIESVVGPAAEAVFVTAAANGELGIEDLEADDYRRCAELIKRYADLRLGLVDASIVAIAERLNLTVVATLYHRDFNVVRPNHCAALELLP